MDRRATLATLLGKKQVVAPQQLNNAGLDPYTGPWDFEQAAHLLRRATFGPTYALIKKAIDLGLEGTIDKLFEDQPLPNPPTNYYYEEDPNVPIGATWIDAPYSRTANYRQYRNRSFQAWILDLILKEELSIREKLSLFWHNHFAISNINDPRFLYRHITLLRTYAWGNFRNLIKEVTIDPSMLRFLNGNQNTRRAPNENYARELLELFTIGKGDLAGPGDYTTYTEEDVVQIARILTGWRDRGYNTTNPEVSIGAFFRPNQHDTGDKQLSERFDKVIISDAGENEYLNLIDIIFSKDEVARFISRKLYRWFIYYKIDADTEANVIEPMAQLIIDNDYEIKPAIVALLKSEHFFDILNVGPMIKNPLDFTYSTLKLFDITLPEESERKNDVLRRMFNIPRNMEMVYFNPPDVAGWKAYYQEPAFYRIWINSTTLPVRMNFTDRLANRGYNYQGFRVKLDPIKFLETIDDPLDPNAVIEEFSKILHPQSLTEGQKKALKEVLIPGLPDYEWTAEYGSYLDDPENSELAMSIENKLRELLQIMMSLPEFYLS